MAKSCPQNELHPTIFISLQPPPADCKSLSVSEEPDILHPVFSDPPLWAPGKWKGNILQWPLPRASTRIQKPGNSTLGRDQEFPSQIHPPPWEVVFNCSLKSLSKLFESLVRPLGAGCAGLRSSPSFSSALPGTGTLGRASIFHCLFQRQYSADSSCAGEGWHLFHGKLLAFSDSLIIFRISLRSLCKWHPVPFL